MKTTGRDGGNEKIKANSWMDGWWRSGWGTGWVARNLPGGAVVVWWWQRYALPHSLSFFLNHGQFLLCNSFSSFKICFNRKWKQEVCLCLWFVLSSWDSQESSTSPNTQGIGDSLWDVQEVNQVWLEGGKDNRRQKEISSLPTLLKERERASKQGRKKV